MGHCWSGGTGIPHGTSRSLHELPTQLHVYSVSSLKGNVLLVVYYESILVLYHTLDHVETLDSTCNINSRVMVLPVSVTRFEPDRLIGVFIDTQTFSVPTSSHKSLSSVRPRPSYYIRYIEGER
jgi:hypothetical protein